MTVKVATNGYAAELAVQEERAALIRELETMAEAARDRAERWESVRNGQMGVEREGMRAGTLQDVVEMIRARGR